MRDETGADDDGTGKAPGRRRRGQPTKFTPEVQAQVCAFIRAGMWDYRAAQSAGISVRTFYNWLERGGAHPRGVYGEFLHEVTNAAAQAAGFAETRVYQENPLAWLRIGPGRDRPGAPGWTESSTVALTAQPGAPLRVVVEYVDAAPTELPQVAAPASVAGNGDRRRDPV